ncbi:MAG TPA: restriction endonuclease subunit S [Bacteroidaceae bacterium]|jgi:type I restriction enzyme S subunit|nr:restriction endonuclease subunit S [Fibrobacter sp.]HOD68090.1 restriction endonuclease subunit S [Bacteroidaceae bacterium]
MDTKLLRQKILDLAIRGKLVPQDPNDEPASVLLEKIRAEKKRLIKEKKIKPTKGKSDKSHYEKEIPFEVPENWEWVKLGEIAQHNVGKTLNKSRDSGEIREYITTSNLYWGRFDFTEIRSMPIEENEFSKCSAIRGDLLICEGGDAGRSAIWNYNYSICFQNHIHRVRPFEGVETKYLYYHMMYIYLNGNIKQYLKGVGIQSLSGTSLASIVLPLPPTNEQILISNEIELLFELIETIEENKVSLEDLIVQTKSKILDLAVRGKLVPQDSSDEPATTLLEQIRKRKKSHKQTSDTSHYPFEVPKNWLWCNFSDLYILISGRDLDKDEFNDVGFGIPYLIGASSLINNQFEVNRWTTTPKVLSEKDDLLITCKGTVGELIINDIGKVHIARQFMAIRSIVKIKTKFTKYFFEYSIETIKERAKGVIPGISRKDILEIFIPLPPLAEQKRIVSQIEKIFAQLEIIEDSLKA